jgi:bifunctional DNase/RNase
MAETPEQPMVEVVLGRIVIHEGSDRQYIFLQERQGKRGFPIVIGSNEAAEIKRVVARIECERPLTHQLTFSIIEACGARIRRCDIVDLRQNTFFAQLVLQSDAGDRTVVLDARPSDAIALALRAGCTLRVAESVLEQVRSDESGPDPLPDV